VQAGEAFLEFCTECGATLSAGLHDHGLRVERLGARWQRRRPSWVALAVGVSGVALMLALVALVAAGREPDAPSLAAFEAAQAADAVEASATSEELAALSGRIAALESENAELNGTVAELEANEAARPPTVPEIADAALRSVVTVSTRFGLGTGFAVEDPTGDVYIITNYHVVESVWIGGGRTVDIAYDDEELSGRIVNVSVAHDLAAIGPVEGIPAIATSKAAPTVGADVVVIGSPYGFDGTVATGVVSALREERIQFSAPVSPGNSGGPLIDGDGVVIGVVVEKVSAQEAEGLSFAIPMDVVCSVVIAC
jgi:S1-C subfamily serine protease